MPLDLDARKPLKLCVLKFGSSVLQKPDDYVRAAHEIYRHTRAGEKVVAVVSALEGETDALFAVGGDVGQGASDGLMARLVRCGELKSAALMGLALERTGIPSAVLDPHEMGLMADGEPLDANLTGLDSERVLAHFENADVIVAPGFFGEGVAGPVTLGRGGTDLTAVEFAHWLDADRVRLIKDVDGVYTDDPARVADAERLDQLDYDEAVRVSRGLVQEKAIFRARDNQVVIEVAALGRPYATRIAGRVQQRPGPVPAARKLKVAVLGHGAVGAGVCSHLLAHPGRFELAPVLVRDAAKHAEACDRPLEFTEDPAVALAGTPDIVVETLGGTDTARALSQSVLRDGSHLVTANKAVVALDIDRLNDLARQQGRQLRYSAAIGGGVPILELVDLLGRNGEILAVEGVMNGTCNFIFDQLKQGTRLADAVSEAQRLGFAEADPSTDLDGHDAADKLVLLAHHAFGVTLHPSQIEKESLNDLDGNRIRAVNEKGMVFKQIARCEATPDGRVEARVEIVALEPDHPLAGLVNEGNGFLVKLPQKTVSVRGKGAGRWPTAEAVFADIMDIQRSYLTGEAEASPVPENPLSHIRRMSTGQVA
ncbi:homoserine dehydrogenase [Maricaulis sp.]|uniref:homoserine dehydrogenase n=1 Tax=Maricaulis sp. TaxID=1486257 RepID=UPI001B0E8047|nr:homoserine dehydrogenase [Maricaulis sp.]MBO6764499.1 homoserine dehydrogenase [Maricaulis sp.]